jgi:hypothetical protein
MIRWAALEPFLHQTGNLALSIPLMLLWGLVSSLAAATFSHMAFLEIAVGSVGNTRVRVAASVP